MSLDQVLLFALLGLGTGALIAGIALGVVLFYRGSGVINLATGAIAMLAGYSFWSLRTGTFGTAGACGAAGSRIGSRIRKVVPTPGSLSSATDPPSLRVSSRTRWSPSPTPPNRRVVDWSLW